MHIIYKCTAAALFYQNFIYAPENRISLFNKNYLHEVNMLLVMINETDLWSGSRQVRKVKIYSFLKDNRPEPLLVY